MKLYYYQNGYNFLVLSKTLARKAADDMHSFEKCQDVKVFFCFLPEVFFCRNTFDL